MKALRILKYVGFGILGLAFVALTVSCHHETLELADSSVIPWTCSHLLADRRVVYPLEDPSYRTWLPVLKTATKKSGEEDIMISSNRDAGVRRVPQFLKMFKK